MSLYRLVYRSRVELPPESRDAEVDRIVAIAARRNAARDITGALMLVGDRFVQALEGPADAVEDLFEEICSDLRHRQVQLLEFTQADERQFAGWGMVRAQAPSGPLADTPTDTAQALASASLSLLKAQLPAPA
ncbi:MAG: BLUF domain-containing protein [Sphingomonadaceae bacterium]